MNADYDVVIIGGGMVGTTLACALGDSDLKVAVVEARPTEMKWDADSVGMRCSAITAASQQIFTSLGAWDAMAAMRVSPFREMQVWDAEGNGAVHFDSADIAQDKLGHIVENRVIQAALTKRIDDFDNIELLCPEMLEDQDTRGEQAQLQLKERGTITARLVVGADGANSRVRQHAGIETNGWPYNQSAIVAMVRTELPHQETAWQRFMPTGPLAFLPLNNGCCSIVWSTSPEHADELLAMDDEAFMTAVSHASEQRLGNVIEVGPRGAFPLKRQHAETYIDNHIALIGDAAHAIHPLAGQGVNLGLLDAAALAEVLLAAHAKNKNIGATHVLRRYERWRKGDNLIMMTAMDGFKKLFGSDNLALKWLRNEGLAIADKLPPLKNQIMLHAMGYKGDLPALARYAAA
ncbi:MAG: UbiH/UbiF/VisC/COQ6 family ubiquinone biosynthesis hydroxylase [Thiotrichaceae bacterium]|nr:UbiH/UbiF/VisC/COQ6 family ubiquinone biosynthesis hydroxylase [Thiotrichaceae bacterium]PCI10255.1 MAG: 2-octaprenyl-3-methyl-6-methoxy-1,4-benzoquinol hydroxylase [Thiotrichales bacterium]PCI12217.1 MAG: 2-octaprenyl-3-methyl-6-methoxy-1,4-benzoquinol hydroxylase [Thiotrichales bacterium]